MNIMKNKPTTADEIRRKILKSGAALVPVVISLQSGTAWAISTCITNHQVPSPDDVRAMLENPDAVALIKERTLLDDHELDKMRKVDDRRLVHPQNIPGEFYTDTEQKIKSGEVVWLLVNDNSAGSCWTSFCTNRENGILGVGLGDACNRP